MLAFDCETVPAVELTEQVARLAARREQATDQFCCLFPPLAKVVAVGMRDEKSGAGTVLVHGAVQDPGPDLNYSVEFFGDERSLLLRVATILGKVTSLLSFNGRSYDIPVLIHRMVINDVPVAPILTKAANQKPWESGFHVDLMNDMAFGGAIGRYPLEAYCLAYGVPNPKEHGDGAGVGELVTAGKTLDLAAYCMGDVDATVELWRKWS